MTWSAEDSEFVGLVAESPSLFWLAAGQLEALGGIRRLVNDVVADLTSTGESVRTPIAEREYSGEFKPRIPPELLRDLAIQAAEGDPQPAAELAARPLVTLRPHRGRVTESACNNSSFQGLENSDGFLLSSQSAQRGAAPHRAPRRIKLSAASSSAPPSTTSR